MPLYEYQCVNKNCAETFEIRHSFDSSPTLKCEICGEEIRRKFSAVPVIYKGSGFYTTDYKQKNSASRSEETKSKSPTNKTENKTENKTDKTDKTKKPPSSSKPTDTPKSTKK